MAKKKQKKQAPSPQSSSEKSLPGHSKSPVHPYIKWSPIILAMLVYAVTLGHDYALDDKTVIAENKFVKEGFNGISTLTTHAYWYGYNGLNEGSYRPLPLISYAIEYGIFGSNPFVGHLTSLILYSLVLFLLIAVLNKLFKDYHFSIPIIISLLFALHPIHVEVVANVKGRDELLCLIGLLGCILFLIKHYIKPNKKHLALALSGYFIALLSKEIALPFIAIIPLTLFMLPKSSIKKVIQTCAPLVGVLVIYMLLRSSFIDGLGPVKWFNSYFQYESDNSNRMATAFYGLFYYIRLLFVPHPMVYDYSYNYIPVISWGSLKGFGSLLLVIGLLVYSIIRIRNRDPIGYGILFFFLSISLVANIVIPMAAIMAERFLFIPSLGFCICLGLLIAKICKIPWKSNSSSIPNKSVFGIMALVLIAYSYQTFSRSLDWKDTMTLFSKDVTTATDNARVHFNLGREYAILAPKDKVNSETVYKKAIDELNKSLAIDAKFYDARFLLGVVYANMKDYKNAVNNYSAAAAINPEQTEPTNSVETALLNLGINYENMGDFESAIKAYLKLIVYKPKYRPIQKQNLMYAYNNLGNAYNNLKDYTNAAKYCTKAIQLNPKYTRAYFNLGNALVNSGNHTEAIANYKKVIQLDPKNGDVYNNLGIAYLNNQSYQEAVKALLNATTFDPDNASAFNNLGIAYRNLGNTTRALKSFKEAARLNPKYKQVYKQSGININ
ncbi:tetratricopeptide repeat protein [bacterium AH-315-C07]|nr:tetratricopeptide repeat protein [bacterium AH-315-C07]